MEEEFEGHRLRDVPAEDAPAVALEAEPDEHGGWNLHLDTEGFTFTPDQVNGPARAGRGTRTCTLTMLKFSRVYSEWFFLPAEAVGSAEHELMVRLNADDHSVWAADGEPAAAMVTVAGTDGDHSHGHGHPTTPAPHAADAELFEFEIVDGRASPPLERAGVEQGATVRIVVSSDQPDEVHLHGYDRTADAGPGQDVVIEFVADQTGLFELETHATGLVLLQLQVQ